MVITPAACCLLPRRMRRTPLRTQMPQLPHCSVVGHVCWHPWGLTNTPTNYQQNSIYLAQQYQSWQHQLTCPISFEHLYQTCHPSSFSSFPIRFSAVPFHTAFQPTFFSAFAIAASFVVLSLPIEPFAFISSAALHPLLLPIPHHLLLAMLATQLIVLLLPLLALFAQVCSFEY